MKIAAGIVLLLCRKRCPVLAAPRGPLALVSSTCPPRLFSRHHLLLPASSPWPAERTALTVCTEPQKGWFFLNMKEVGDRKGTSSK